MLFRTLGASLLGNLLISKDTIRAGESTIQRLQLRLAKEQLELVWAFTKVLSK